MKYNKAVKVKQLQILEQYGWILQIKHWEKETREKSRYGIIPFM